MRVVESRPSPIPKNLTGAKAKFFVEGEMRDGRRHGPLHMERVERAPSSSPMRMWAPDGSPRTLSPTQQSSLSVYRRQTSTGRVSRVNLRASAVGRGALYFAEGR